MMAPAATPAPNEVYEGTTVNARARKVPAPKKSRRALALKILFLDIDGVVNCHSTEQRFNGYLGIDPKLAGEVKRIIRETGCDVVLSSTWRLDAPFRQQVRMHVCNFIDVTIDNRGLTDRGCEVKDWLEKHPEVTKYAILDDNSDFHQEQHLFRTSVTRGITPEIADQVIEHLGKS